MTSHGLLIEKAVADGAVAGVVLLARDKAGKLNITRSHGVASLASTAAAAPAGEPGGADAAEAAAGPAGAEAQPMTPDTLLALASLTKLLTTVAVLQQVERGALSLDQDVSSLVPALAAQPVFREEEVADSAASAEPGAHAGELRPGHQDAVEPRREELTLRRLLNHSAGTGYTFLNERIGGFVERKKKEQQQPGKGQDEKGTPQDDKKKPSGTIPLEERFDYPLLYQPGQGWCYGSAVDWAGRCVEVVTGSSLEAYLAENVLAPLDIPPGSITFFPDRQQRNDGGSENDKQPRRPRAELTHRDPSSPQNKAAPGGMPATMYSDTVECLGGVGAFGALGEYIKILTSLLRDDGKLLRPETAALMFEPSLEPAAGAALRKAMETPDWVVGDIPPPAGEYDWGLGGLLVAGDSHAYRRRGCLMWSAMFNCFWFIDRAAGVCGVFGAQVLPPGDPTLKSMIKSFEEEVYAQAKKLAED